MMTVASQTESYDWQAQEATPKQLELLRKGNVMFKPGLTRGEASELIDELLESGALVEGYTLADFERYDPRAPRGNKTERRFCCLLCGDSKPRDRAHRSVSANTVSGKWLCHRCGIGGILKEFRQANGKGRLTRAEWSRSNAAKMFALKPRASQLKPEPTPEEIEKETRWRDWWDVSSELASTRGAEYLGSRSIPIDLAEASGVRFGQWWRWSEEAQKAEPFDAVLFPIKSLAGDLVAVSARAIDGTDKRTRGDKSAGVFPTPGALNSQCVAITEAPIDALALSACDVPAVAMVGTSWAEWLPRVLAFRSVLIATDNDKPGDDTAAKLTDTLQPRGAHVLRLKPRRAKDWAEALQTCGVECLRTHLRGFAHTADDEIRVSAARDLAKAGRVADALFIVRLLPLELRSTISAKINQLVVARA